MKKPRDMANNLQFRVQPFERLSVADFYRIAQARESVFVVEQQCAYQELDGLDPAALHIQGSVDAALAVYARIIPPTVHPTGKPAIGRVLTLAQHRGQGYARALMHCAMSYCQHTYPRQPIYISAQHYLVAFYQSLGFMVSGEPYLEDNIAHIDMLRKEARS